jgi:hypothetical protein
MILLVQTSSGAASKIDFPNLSIIPAPGVVEKASINSISSFE